MDEKDFELLEVLDETRNITHAADKLYMTQSALSKRIKSMEQELGVEILLRSRQGIRFTPAGEKVLEHSRAALKQMEQLRRAMVQSMTALQAENTRKLDEITFDEMLELASLGAQVLNNRSVELAKKYNVELEVLSSLNPVPGTVVKEVVKDVEGMLIKGVAKDTDVAVITILNVPDEPGTSFKIFGLLAQKNVNVDIILQSTGRDGKKDISFTCSEGEADLAMRVLKESAHFNDVSVDTTCAKVSIVGAGMQSHSGVASKMFEALSNNNINIKMISTSEIKISCIINRDDADKAVSAIHDMLFD